VYEGSGGDENQQFHLSIIDTTVTAGAQTYTLVTSDRGGSFSQDFGEVAGPVISVIELSSALGVTGPTGAGATGWTGATGPTGRIGPTGPGSTTAGANTQVQYNTGGALGASSNFVFDFNNNRVGIGTNAPASVLDVVGSSTNPIYLRAPTYSRVAVQDIGTGTNTVTVATSNSGLNYNLSNSSFSNITLPASTTALTEGGAFWSFRNNAVTNLSITLTNNANLTTPIFLGAGNNITISVSSNANNTYILL
jgi:hypothetical protein